MTGCPNGCARPYTAEIGIVGQSAGLVSLYLGGSPLGTRLAQLFRHEVRLEDVAAVLGQRFEEYVAERVAGERFGDWAARKGASLVREPRELRGAPPAGVYVSSNEPKTLGEGAWM